MWYNQTIFRNLVTILVVLLCIFVFLQILPLFANFLWLVTNVILSVILALILYYVTRPLRDYLQSKKVPRLVAISIIYFVLLLIFSSVIMFIWPFLIEQVNSFAETPQEKIKQVEKTAINIFDFFELSTANQEAIRANFLRYVQQAMLFLVNNITFALGSIAIIASYIVLTPFVLYYLLKEDYGMFSAIVDINPWIDRKNIKHIFYNVDATLANYISGQVLVAAIVGFLVFIGYFIIGLKFSLILALLAFLFNLIPFCGPFISTIPAFLIGFSESPLMGFKVILVVLTVHMLDMNFISPRVVGYTLKIHPVAIVLLLVLGFNLGGLIGLFLITPLYAVLKTLTIDLLELRKTAKLKEDVKIKP